MTLGTASPGPAPSASVEAWFREARNYLQAAEAASREHLWRQACQQAGQAVELALKGRIMHRERFNQWPARSQRRDLYVHDLGKLAAIAGVQPFFEQEALAGSKLGLAWMIAKDFDINRRYPGASGSGFPVRLGRDMVAAVGRDGLLQWLMSP